MKNYEYAEDLDILYINNNSNNEKVNVDSLHLIGVSSLFMAAKLEEI